MAQVFVVVAAGSVIGFIIRDLGDAPLAGWIIQVRCFLQAQLQSQVRLWSCTIACPSHTFRASL
jgi:hypothetical protein